MGLDIYFRRVKRQFEGDPTNFDDFHNFREQVDADAQVTLRKKFNKFLAPLREAWDRWHAGNDYWKGIYAERYFHFVEQIRPLIAGNYDWKIRPYCENGVIELPKLEEMLDEEVNEYYEPYNTYFRKVNFLFAYFQNKGKMIDEYYAFVEKEDVDDIINKCEQILAAKKGDGWLDEGETIEEFAASLLPTQSGFFFGGTDYDEYYFWDVKDCLRHMKKYRSLFKGEGTGYVIFSW